MSLSAEAIDALVAAGATPEMLAAVFKAELAAEEARRASKRAGARERQSRKRAKVDSGHAMSRDVTNVTRDARDSLSLPPSPQTPQPPTHTLAEVSTHAREADWPTGAAMDHAEALAMLNPNIDLQRQPGLRTTVGEIHRWKAEGVSWLLDVVPAVQAHAQRPRSDPVKGWNYFTPAVRQSFANRTRPAEPLPPSTRHERSDAQNAKFDRKQRNLAVAGSVRPAQRGAFIG